jgi:hypothetical protein
VDLHIRGIKHLGSAKTRQSAFNAFVDGPEFKRDMCMSMAALELVDGSHVVDALFELEITRSDESKVSVELKEESIRMSTQALMALVPSGNVGACMQLAQLSPAAYILSDPSRTSCARLQLPIRNHPRLIVSVFDLGHRYLCELVDKQLERFKELLKCAEVVRFNHRIKEKVDQWRQAQTVEKQARWTDIMLSDVVCKVTAVLWNRLLKIDKDQIEIQLKSDQVVQVRATASAALERLVSSNRVV